MESIKKLREICQNPVEYHNPRSLFENRLWRPFSIYITKLLLFTSLKPNHVTFFMIFWAFLSGLLFSIGTYWYMLAGAIVLAFLYILDAVDGEMARYKKMTSLEGVYLDLVAHLANIAVPFIGLTIGLYKSNPDITIVLAGLSASAFSVFCLNLQSMKHHVVFRELVKNTQNLGKIKLKIKKNLIEKQTIQKKSLLTLMGKKINLLYDSIYINPIILTAAVFGKLDWVLFFYGSTFPLMWLTKLIYEYKVGYKPYEYLLKSYKR